MVAADVLYGKHQSPCCLEWLHEHLEHILQGSGYLTCGACVGSGTGEDGGGCNLCSGTGKVGPSLVSQSCCGTCSQPQPLQPAQHVLDCVVVAS